MAKRKKKLRQKLKEAQQMLQRQQQGTGKGTPLKGQGTPLKGKGTPLKGQGTPLKGQGTPLKGQGDPGRGRPVGTDRPSSLSDNPLKDAVTKPTTPTPGGLSQATKDIMAKRNDPSYKRFDLSDGSLSPEEQAGIKKEAEKQGSFYSDIRRSKIAGDIETAGRQALQAAGREKTGGGSSVTLTSTPVDTPKPAAKESGSPTLTGGGDGKVYADSPAGQALKATFESSDPSATSPEYVDPKNKKQLLARQEAAASLMEAMEMSPGNDREDAIARASMQAQQAGVTASRIDDFIKNPAYAKAAKLQQVRAAGREAAEAGKPVRPQLSSRGYAQKAAEARAAGFTGVQGSGGLAELYQMQSDRASGKVAPGTFTALSKPAKRIAPDSRIKSRLASKVAKGELDPESAYDEFQKIKDAKMAYNNPRRAALMKQRELAEMNYRIEQGLPLPEKKKGRIEGRLSRADRRRAEREAGRFSNISRSAGGEIYRG